MMLIMTNMFRPIHAMKFSSQSIFKYMTSRMSTSTTARAKRTTSER